MCGDKKRPPYCQESSFPFIDTMRLKTFLHESENKYTHLLVLLVAFFFFIPLIVKMDQHFPIIAAIFFLAIVLTLRAIRLDRHSFAVSNFFGILALIMSFGSLLEIKTGLQQRLMITALMIFAVFLIIAIVMMVRKIFATMRVTDDMIRGGISIYLLLGYLWALFFYMIFLLDPKAFITMVPWSDNMIFHFSFATLTTLGYGDIVPANPWAASLANLEAVTGQLFIGIFVARLVGLYIMQQKSRHDNI